MYRKSKKFLVWKLKRCPMKKCINKLLGLTALTLLFAGLNSQAVVLLEDDFSSGSITPTARAYESQIDSGWVKAQGYSDVVASAWAIGDGVVSNASTVAATGYKLSTAAESPLTQVFSNTANSDSHLRFSVDYSVASGDTLYVHLWGYTGVVVTASGWVSNMEGGANGNVSNDEGSSGSGLNAFNLKDGATTGFGGAGTAISGELTGSGTVEVVINIASLGISGVKTAGDFTYYLIGIGKDEDGTAGTTSVDNLSLISEMNPVILQDDFSSGSVPVTFRAYESEFDQGWWKCWGPDSETMSQWVISGGVVENSSTNAASGYPLSKPAEAALFQTFNNIACSNTHLNLSFDYSVPPGDKLYAHLWGYTGTITPIGYVCNIEGSANGGISNSEGSGGSTLDAFNLKDGATTGFGSAATAISGELTGSGTFSTSISISDLGIAGVQNTADFDYFLIAFAKDEDGNPGSTSMDNVSLIVAPAPIPKGTIILIQ
jgi:hypothetical protein